MMEYNNHIRKSLKDIKVQISHGSLHAFLGCKFDFKVLNSYDLG